MMIFRLYGTAYQSVDVDFDAKALNEISFRRNREASIPADELEARYETVDSVALSETASGRVQSETEQAMLEKLQARLDELIAGVEELDDGSIIVVENEQGHDWPKPKQEITNVVEGGENRMHFDYSMSPPLRITVRRPNA